MEKSTTLTFENELRVSMFNVLAVQTNSITMHNDPNQPNKKHKSSLKTVRNQKLQSEYNYQRFF